MFKTLQVGRGFAAVAVCAFHLSLAFNDPRFGQSALFFGLTQFGRFGVDFFFVLSGFIIMHAHREDIGKTPAINRFLKKRFVRIYPLYWLLTFVVILIAVASGKPHIGLDANLISIISLFKFTPISSPLTPAWTLFHEIFFYIIFSLAILSRRFGICAGVIWVAAIYLADLLEIPVGPLSLLGLISSPINLCFLGGIFAYLIHSRLNAKQAIILASSGTALIFISLAYISEKHYPLFFAVSMATGFAVLLAAVVRLEKMGVLSGVAIFALIGDASYSLYLSHQILQAALLKAATVLTLNVNINLPILYVGTLVSMVVISIALHLWLEKPLTRYFSQFMIGPRIIHPSSVIAEEAASHRAPL